MTEHEIRVEIMLQDIEMVLAEMLSYLQSHDGEFNRANTSIDHYLQNVRFMTEKLIKELEKQSKPKGIKKLLRWFKREP